MSTTEDAGGTQELAPDEIYCTKCGSVIKEAAEICPECGVRRKDPPGADSQSEEVTDRTAFSRRSLGMQVLFSVVTLGIYTIYWYHITHKQLANGTSADFSPAMRTVGLFIPFYNFVVLWRTSHDAEAVTDQSGAVLFLFNMVFPPAYWYIIQSGINAAADG